MFKNKQPKRTYQALGALLTYPTDELVAALPDIWSVLAVESLLSRPALGALEVMMAGLRDADPFDREEAYVAQFDHSKATSLHLFEHVHGDSRDRGQAMVDMQAMYREAGLEIAANELPDFLPLYLEFLSTQPADTARELLAEIGHLLPGIHATLTKRGSDYAAVFAALLELAGEQLLAAGEGLGETVPAAKDDLDLDTAWAEPAAFGGSCGTAKSVLPEQAVIQIVPRQKNPAAGPAPSSRQH